MPDSTILFEDTSLEENSLLVVESETRPSATPPIGAVPLTEEFDDPFGRLVYYDARDTAAQNALAARQHINIRSFTYAAAPRIEMINLDTIQVSDLDNYRVGNSASALDLESPRILDAEVWSSGTIASDPTRRNFTMLSLTCPAGQTTTTVSNYRAVDLETGFDDSSVLSVVVPDFPMGDIDLAHSYFDITEGSNTVSLRFSDSTVQSAWGNNERIWPRSELGSILRPTRIGFRFKAINPTTVRIAAIRLRLQDRDISNMSVNTTRQRYVPSIDRLLGDNPMPTLYRGTGADDDPMPIDINLGIGFFTGAAIADDRIDIYLRERREDFIQMVDINATTMAAMDGKPLPDFGRAMYTTRPQEDLDTYGQSDPDAGGPLSGLDDYTQWELERLPDTISQAYTKISLTWGTLGNHLTIANSETHTGNEYAITPNLLANTYYVLKIYLRESSIRAVIHQADDYGRVITSNVVGDTDTIYDDFMLKRRKGRFGWNIDLGDGNAWVSNIATADTVFKEFLSHPLESITPVAGARLQTTATANRQFPVGLVAHNNANLTVNPGATDSVDDDSIQVNAFTPLDGAKTTPILIDTFEETVATFDIYIPAIIRAQGTTIRLGLLNAIGALIPLTMDPIEATDTWITQRIELGEASAQETGSYRLYWYQTGAEEIFWQLRNVSIRQRQVKWEARSMPDDPWGIQTTDWVPFKDLVNDPRSGVVFGRRGTQLQVRAQALSHTASIDKLYILPKYAELGGFKWAGSWETVNMRKASPTHPTPRIVSITPTAGAVSFIIDGNTYNWPATSSSPAAYYYHTDTSLTFTATTLETPGPGTVTYLWDFGDGVFATGAVVTHSYQFPNPGVIVSVAALVRNNQGIVTGTYRTSLPLTLLPSTPPSVLTTSTTLVTNPTLQTTSP
jgi:hypothetical protein